MWIQESPWEKKNLGIESSAVFHLEENDDQAVLPEIIDNQSYVYQEAVIPMNRIDLVNGLLSGGFRFAEVAIVQSMAPICKLPKAYERHLPEFSLHVADAENLKQIFGVIDSGTVFQTDKISLNPCFGYAIAARRYGNWMRTEVGLNNVCPFIICRGNEAVGFSIMKSDEKNDVVGLLSGLMNKSRNPSLGIYLGYYTIEAARQMGARKVKAHISSNNPSVLKVNQALGYQIESMSYILTRTIKTI